MAVALSVKPLINLDATFTHWRGLAVDASLLNDARGELHLLDVPTFECSDVSLKRFSLPSTRSIDLIAVNSPENASFYEKSTLKMLTRAFKRLRFKSIVTVLLTS